jgi:DNA-binding beta-propeller fold protein YncE/mono/diheme cytochrome c family protein
MGRGLIHPPNPGAMVSQTVPPPAVSGGTLRVLADGLTAVAADPDRDRVYVVDLSARAVTATVPLEPGDEPGRVIEDAAGRVHVALRHGGAIATFDPRQPVVSRRAVCPSPRGLAYDGAADLVHVACADGELVSLPAAGGAADRTLQLERDLRDVVVDGARLRVSRFRSAELLTIESDGRVSNKTLLPSFSAPAARAGERFTAGTAWKMTATADGGVAVLHQRGVVDTIRPVPGGYGGFNPCNAIVHTAVTAVAADGTVKTGPVLPGLVMAVDMAISPDGNRVAFVAMANATNAFMGATAPQLTRVYVTDMAKATDAAIGCRPDGMNGPCLAPSSTILDPSGNITGCPANPQTVGQPIAIAFAGDGSVVVQSREPAFLALADGSSIWLSTESRADTGHFFFHANAGGFVACASCHTEGDDDGRVWSFGCNAAGVAAGPRRTQSLHTGLRGTEPFHWSGDEADFTALMKDVFVARMSGPTLAAPAMDALVNWIDAQPRPRRPAPSNPEAVARGALLFSDTRNVGCATCHAGPRFSSGLSVDVGTGGPFQVPSLVGIGTRGPFMHDGCAKTLHDRFSAPCGGGESHGATSHLTAGQIDDLVAYLNTL